MAVEVEEQHCTTELILALIKFSAKQIVNVRVVVLWGKQITRLSNALEGKQLYEDIEVDKIAVDIRKDITGVVGIEEYRASAHKGFDKTLTRRQALFNIIEQGVFPPCPFQKSAIFFHAD